MKEEQCEDRRSSLRIGGAAELEDRMAQEQIQASGGLRALACYTVDSEDESEEEEEVAAKGGAAEEGFGSLYIKEEPAWGVDTEGYKEPQDIVVLEFTEPQIKVEIVSDSDGESSSSDSSSEEEEEEQEKKEKVEVEKEEGPLKTKNEYSISDLPAVEEVEVRVAASQCQAVGTVSSVVEQLLVIESLPDLPAIDLESVLFAGAEGEEEMVALGRVFDVIGPVTRPYYCVRFNSEEHVKSKNLVKGQQIFFAPKTEHTSFVFLEQLMKMKISDASWCNDEEVPLDFQEFSDDEQETKSRQSKKIAKMVEKGADPAQVNAKKARMDQGRARQDQRGPRPQQQDPRVNNGLYAQHANPFYRQQRAYDPRAMGAGIRWGDYNVPPQQYAPHQPYQAAPLHPVHQYHQNVSVPPYNPYSVPPPPIPNAPRAHAALQGASWGAQYNSNSAPPLPTSRPAWANPPPPPPAEG